MALVIPVFPRSGLGPSSRPTLRKKAGVKGANRRHREAPHQRRLGNEPLSADSAVVLFKPDASKGNTSPFEPVGNVDQKGNYALATTGDEWYVIGRSGPLISPRRLPPPAGFRPRA